MKRTSIRSRDVQAVFRRPRGYRDKTTPWTGDDWSILRQNADLNLFPSMAKPAITLRNTNLRELPTQEPCFEKPGVEPASEPFDYFQYSLLPIGTPLLVAHATKDGLWYYVECPIAGGWASAKDIAFVDEEFRRLWKENAWAALIKDNVPLPGTGPAGSDSQAGIGAILPLLSASGAQLNVAIPVQGEGNYAHSAELQLNSAQAARFPLSLTPGNMAAVGNGMMSQPYGWGGYLGRRDCSAMIRDLYAPFGLWLPRNSATQARRGIVIPLAGLTLGQKESIILQKGVPFMSLIGMRGHITLYVGEWKNRPAIFHNAWGIRIIKDGNDNERFVIGKAAITTITPGAEMENLYLPETFMDRIATLTLLGRN